MFNVDEQRVTARDDRVLVEELGDELVVYDLDTDTAHLLNPVARRIYETARGSTTVGALLHLVEGDEATRRDLVQAGLTQLHDAGLLIDYVHPVGISRRQLLRRAAIAAVAAPIVTSIIAPTPAAAQTGGATCVAFQGTCTPVTGTPCCSPNTCNTQSNRCCVSTSVQGRPPGDNCSQNTQCCSGSCNGGTSTCN